METQEAVCIKDWHVEAQNGDRQDCHWGKTYTVHLHDDGETVTVFSRFWVRAPKEIFAGFRPLGSKP